MAATILGATYALGYVVVTLNNAHYGFYDAGLFHPRIISAGCALIVAVGLPVCITVYGSMLLPILPKDPLRPPPGKSALGAIATFTLALTFACSFLSMASRAIFDEGHQGAGIWKVSLYSFLLILLVTGVQTFLSHWRKSPRWHSMFWEWLAWGSVMLINGYLILLGCSRTMDSMQFKWLIILSIFVAGMRFDFDTTEKLRTHPWIGTALMVVIVISSFTSYIYPIMKPFWGGMPQPIEITFEEKSATQNGGRIEAKLIEQTSDGFYMLLGNNSHATFLPRSSVARIEY